MIMGDIELIREALECMGHECFDDSDFGVKGLAALEALTRIEQESKTNAE